MGEHVAIVGPNGAGKTTLLRLLAGYRHPTRGEVRVLGEQLGHTDVRVLRRRVGFTSTALHPLLQTSAPAALVVAAGRHGATAHIPGRTDREDDRRRAVRALSQVGGAHLADRRCRTLSQGEWQRVQIARALVTDPELLLLDEPMAGLDIGGRESLVADLDRLMTTPDGPTVVLVSHHLEEVPAATRSAVVLADGAVTAAGPIGDVFVREVLSAAFGLSLTVEQRDGRWLARSDGHRVEDDVGEGQE